MVGKEDDPFLLGQTVTLQGALAVKLWEGRGWKLLQLVLFLRNTNRFATITGSQRSQHHWLGNVIYTTRRNERIDTKNGHV